MQGCIQGLDQDVHFFYVQSHFMATKVVSHFPQPIFITFHIEIVDDTFQFLNFVIGKKL